MVQLYTTFFFHIDINCGKANKPRALLYEMQAIVNSKMPLFRFQKGSYREILKKSTNQSIAI